MATVADQTREDMVTALEEIYTDVDDTNSSWIDTTEDTTMIDTMAVEYASVLTDDTDDSTEDTDTYTESERTAYETGMPDDSTSAECTAQRILATAYTCLVDGDTDAALVVFNDPLPEQGPSLPPEIVEAEKLAREVAAMQAEFDAEEKARAEKIAKLKALQAQAVEAKAKAPVLITPELRERLAAFEALCQLDEQGRAKAITSGLLFVRIASDKAAKKDTGVVRNVPHVPSSSGTVELNRHGSASSAVNSGNKTMSAEMEAVQRKIQEVRSTIPAGLAVSDGAIAKQALAELAALYAERTTDEKELVRLGAKIVFHQREKEAKAS